MRRRSRYQDWLRSTKRSRARSETVIGDRPGGTPRHFCVPEYARSTPQSSAWNGQAADRRDAVDQQQGVALAGGDRLDVGAHAGGRLGVDHADEGRDRMGRQQPVGVDRRPPVEVDPDDLGAGTGRRPRTCAAPNTPFTPMTAVSPGPSTLTMHVSMPADPVPLIGMVSALFVPKTRRSRSHTSSSRARNSGSRWPSIGRAKASMASGYGLHGPGPIRMRSERGTRSDTTGRCDATRPSRMSDSDTRHSSTPSHRTMATKMHGRRR